MPHTKDKNRVTLHTKSGEKEVKKIIDAARKAVEPHSKEHKYIIIAHSEAWRKLANK